MPNVVQNRIALIVAAAVICGGGATAIAVAFPGREAPRIAAPPVQMVATPEPFPTLAPTAAPTATPVPAAQSYTPRRSTTVRTQPTRRPTGGSADTSQLPGPAQKAVGDPPAQPRQPDSPDQP